MISQKSNFGVEHVWIHKNIFVGLYQWGEILTCGGLYLENWMFDNLKGVENFNWISLECTILLQHLSDQAL